jgi:nitroreductase
MEFYEVLRKHLDKPFPNYIITKLIENARSPSAGHTQVQEFIIEKDPSIKSKLGKTDLGQSQIYDADVLIVVCFSISRSVGRYGDRGKDFYSIIVGGFASMLVLLTSIKEGIGASFVGAFEDQKVSKILNLPEYVKVIGIVTLGYPAERPEMFERIDISKLGYYSKYGNLSP